MRNVSIMNDRKRIISDVSSPPSPIIGVKVGMGVNVNGMGVNVNPKFECRNPKQIRIKK